MSETPSGDVPPPAAPERKPSGCWKALVLSFLATLLVGGVVAWKFVDSTASLARRGSEWLARVSEKLQTRTLEETIEDAILRVTSTQGDILELATIESQETFTSYDMRTLWGNTVYLGTTVSEIQVPVVYRYHLRLSEGWKIEVKGDQCRVIAPKVRPTLPPAIRTDGLQKKSKAGWLRFNAEENLSKLEKEITPKIETRAGDARHLELARAPSRESVAEFVRKWVLDEHPDAERLTIVVEFADEADGSAFLPVLKPATPSTVP
ncbi:MAG: hypothetical protein KDK99_02070 [Verrucomicrobiales bacterium]|nr:hypothetical protein [Verrucomicrobiales bacterium]